MRTLGDGNTAINQRGNLKMTTQELRTLWTYTGNLSQASLIRLFGETRGKDLFRKLNAYRDSEISWLFFQLNDEEIQKIIDDSVSSS